MCIYAFPDSDGNFDIMGVYVRPPRVYNKYMQNDDLDQFLEVEGELVDPEELGTTLVQTKPMTKKEMNESILRVYQELGGDAWLLKQAELYPKEFMSMLKPLIQKEEGVGVTGFNITVNGEAVNIEGRSYKELGVINGTQH